MLQALLKHLPSRLQDSQALDGIEQMEEGHTRLELVVVACEIGREIPQDGAQNVLALLGQVIDMAIRATSLPLYFMEDGAHLFIPLQRRIEVIAVETLTQDPLDMALEFIAVVGAGTQLS